MAWGMWHNSSGTGTYVGSTYVPADQSRYVDLNLVPKKKAKLAKSDMPDEPVASNPDPAAADLKAIQAMTLAAAKTALGELTVAELDELRALEEADDKPRDGMLDMIAAARLNRVAIDSGSMIDDG